MGKEDGSVGNTEEYVKRLNKKFTPVAGIRAKYKIIVQDNPKSKPIIIDVDNSKCDCHVGNDDDCDVIITSDQMVLEDVLEGRMTFQRAFMAGSIKMKGDFKLLRSMDQLFDLMAE